MPCRQFEDLILDYCEDALAPEDRLRVETHIAECLPCRAFLEIQREVEAALPAAIGRPALSPAFRERVLRRIAGQDRESRSWLPLALDAIGFSALAAMAGILLPALVSPAQLVWIVFGACAAFLWWTGFRMLRENRFHL
jgi:anti-sigma factor RsiW